MRAKFFELAVVAVFTVFLAGCTTLGTPSSADHATKRLQTTCVFCQIASGELQKERVVYRDKTVVAFVDRAPRNPGHVLVIPIKHARDVMDVPASTLGEMAEVAQKIAKAIRSTDLRADGFNFISNTGAAAGQSVFHLHLHVIPRFEGETAHKGEHEGIRPSDELNSVAAMLRAKLKTQPN